MTRITKPEIVGIPPILWPPALELPNGKWLSQTGLIISYLSPKLGLAGYAKDDANLDEDEKAFLNAKNTQLVLTALDMLVEVSVIHSGALFLVYTYHCAYRPTTFTIRSPPTSATRTRKQKHCALRNNSEPPGSQSFYNTSNLFSKPTRRTKAAKVMGPSS